MAKLLRGRIVPGRRLRPGEKLSIIKERRAGKLSPLQKRAIAYAIKRVQDHYSMIDYPLLGDPRYGPGVAKLINERYHKNIKNRRSIFSRARDWIVGGTALFLSTLRLGGLSTSGNVSRVKGQAPGPDELSRFSGPGRFFPQVHSELTPETLRTGLIVGSAAALGSRYAAKKWKGYVERTVTPRNLQAHGRYLMEKRQRKVKRRSHR